MNLLLVITISFTSLIVQASDKIVLSCLGDIVGSNGSAEIILYQDKGLKYYATFKTGNNDEPKMIASQMDCSPVDSNYPFVFNCFGDSGTLHGVQQIEFNNYAPKRDEIKVLKKEYVVIEQSYPSEFQLRTELENCTNNR